MQNNHYQVMRSVVAYFLTIARAESNGLQGTIYTITNLKTVIQACKDKNIQRQDSIFCLIFPAIDILSEATSEFDRPNRNSGNSAGNSSVTRYCIHCLMSPINSLPCVSKSTLIRYSYIEMYEFLSRTTYSSSTYFGSTIS